MTEKCVDRSRTRNAPCKANRDARMNPDSLYCTTHGKERIAAGLSLTEPPEGASVALQDAPAPDGAAVQLEDIPLHPGPDADPAAQTPPPAAAPDLAELADLFGAPAKSVEDAERTPDAPAQGSSTPAVPAAPAAFSADDVSELAALADAHFAATGRPKLTTLERKLLGSAGAPVVNRAGAVLGGRGSFLLELVVLVGVLAFVFLVRLRGPSSAERTQLAQAQKRESAPAEKVATDTAATQGFAAPYLASQH